MFSQSQEYALRSVIWLAQQADCGPYGAEQIAQETKASPSYLAKILQQLAEAGILSSRRGVGGGFQLQRDSDSLTMLEVINAVDPIQRIDKCPLNLKTHRDCRCPATPVWTKLWHWSKRHFATRPFATSYSRRAVRNR